MSANIALLIPAYNDQIGLEKSIRSIEGNDKQLVDIIVVDDGSTTAIHLQNLPGYNITLLRLDRNQGIEHALNAGLTYILERDYSYIARLDARDFVAPGRFATQQSFLDTHPDIGIVGSWVQTISPDGTPQFILQLPLDDASIRTYMHLNSSFCHPAVMIRSSVLKQTGLYSTHYKSAEDYELFFRILRISKGANVPESLIFTEVLNTQGISYKRRYQQLRSRLRIQLHYFNPLLKNSYIGVIKTLVTLLLPYKVIHTIKNILYPARIKVNK